MTKKGTFCWSVLGATEKDRQGRLLLADDPRHKGGSRGWNLWKKENICSLSQSADVELASTICRGNGPAAR